MATTGGPAEMTGLALVAVTAAGPGKGAVLSDESGRFGTTVGDMLQQMRQLAPGAGATTSLAATAVTAAPAPAGGSQSAASPLGPLHASPLPDGSGSIGLPDGWRITAAHAGEVIAQGPAPAALHFDYMINAYDPGRTSPGSGLQFVPTMHAIPYGAVVSDVTPSDGSTPLRAWTQIFVGPLNAIGGYVMTLYQIVLPQQQSTEQGDATAKALFAGYHADAQQIIRQLGADKTRSDQTVAAIQRRTAEN